MHSVMVISGGLVLLALFCLVGRLSQGRPGLVRGARAFVPVWALGSVVNMTIGVVSAGYTVWQELPILVVVFGVPAAAAMLVARAVPRR